MGPCAGMLNQFPEWAELAGGLLNRTLRHDLILDIQRVLRVEESFE